MRILVCIKRIPDLETMTFPDIPPKSPANFTCEGTPWRMNRYDEYAVEAALRLRETHGASRIDALTVGDQDAGDVLRRAIGMGVDHGVHIQKTREMFPSPFTIGELITAYAREKAYDVILCGVMSEDLMQGGVGPIIAGLLKWPCLTAIHTMNDKEEGRVLRCEREVEGGRQEVLEVRLPALLTIQSGIHTPRYPALSKLLRANQYPLEVLPSASLSTPTDRQRVCAITPPEKVRAGVMMEGTAESKAHQLSKLFHAKGLC
ncbi:MAG: electron transfer flavoprotein subunit beta/FixA family protein [Desulfobacteraceae bacterium]|nr:electron transfer flavoprotein subunit beta/FixA family protein [Desulfobacteraceae bacterium]MBC2750989.1 electron transfer flavoprotein subunit beta/FixA family protein [Desulfobacteraceae bacterium]